MPEFDHFLFDIEFALNFDTFVPTSKRARSEWSHHAAEKIAARLRRGWEFTRKPGIPENTPGYFPKIVRHDDEAQ